jgi:isocitrate/isopropylmalate dehydrogenase
MMLDNWAEQIGGHEAIFFGAIGWPDAVPNHEALWGFLFKFRREFDQYINLRPVRLMPGVPSPLAGRRPGDIDFFIVRENTEGEYSNSGGILFGGTPREVVIQESVFTRVGGGSRFEVCVRTGAKAWQASDGGDEIQWYFYFHALVGRARGGDGRKLCRCTLG